MDDFQYVRSLTPESPGWVHEQLAADFSRLRAEIEALFVKNVHLTGNQLKTETVDLIAELRRERDRLRAEVESLRWRCVADEMPEHEGTYLCHFSDGVIETFPYEGEYYPGMWGVSGTIVTHWMPLPEPPVLRGEGE